MGAKKRKKNKCKCCSSFLKDKAFSDMAETLKISVKANIKEKAPPPEEKSFLSFLKKCGEILGLWSWLIMSVIGIVIGIGSPLMLIIIF